MLSPGQWHLKVPTVEMANVKYRRDIRARALGDVKFQAGIKHICKNDIIFFINVFVWQYNPNKLGDEVGPFITWDFQETSILKMLGNVVRRKDILVEKSREMGASWLILILFLWLWLFWPRLKFLCMSRMEELVESDDEDSLFWKLDFMLERLPAWLRPKMKRRKKYFGNLENGSSITGTATTGKAGVGGRATAILLDEFSQNKDDYEVLHRTSDTSKCRIFNGTHLGLDTAFYELSQRADMDKLVMHWTEHPDKRKGMYRYDADGGKVEVLDTSYVYPDDFRFVMDGSPTGGPLAGFRSPWYDGECIRKGSSRAIAMDLDIDPKGSVSQFFDRLMIMTLVRSYTCEPYWEGELNYDRSSGRSGQFVPLKGGAMKLWLRPDGTGKPAPGIYAFGVDVATGNGATPSCIGGFNAMTGEKILEYSNSHILPEKLAYLLVALCWLFKSEDGQGAMLGWETPGPGLMLGTVIMKDLGYRNVYYNAKQYIGGEPSERPGWINNPSNLEHLLEEYRAGLHSRQCLNRSKKSLEECLAFEYDSRGVPSHGKATSTNDPSAARFNHADQAIADAIGWKLVKSLGVQQTVKKVEPPPTVLSLQGRRDWHNRREREEFV
jgi:hypothetical protein